MLHPISHCEAEDYAPAHISLENTLKSQPKHHSDVIVQCMDSRVRLLKFKTQLCHGPSAWSWRTASSPSFSGLRSPKALCVGGLVLRVALWGDGRPFQRPGLVRGGRSCWGIPLKWIPVVLMKALSMLLWIGYYERSKRDPIPLFLSS